MRTVGIDPGYERCGIAVVEKVNGKEVLLFSDCIQTSKDLPISERLFEISEQIQKVIDDWKPDNMGIEKLFFSNNQKTAGSVNEARGMILSKAAENNLRVFQYTPAQIKVAVTGYGKSDKKQIIFMIPKLLKVNKPIKYDDEYDAIAVALTCLASVPKRSSK
jgi:crossover junction endodeoxyribonuclease RuvC